MSDIVINNKNYVYIHIECDYSIANELVDHFTFFVPGYKFMPSYKNKMWDGKIRLFNSRTKELYAGLYQYVVEFANVREYSIECTDSDYYGRPDTFNDISIEECEAYSKALNLRAGVNEITARDYQISAFQHALERKNALLLSPTASGKSLIIYNLIRWYLEHKDKNILIIVPTTSLVEQLASDFSDYYGDYFKTHKIYSGKEKANFESRVVISTWQSIYKLKAPWFKDFGMVVGDEAHQFKAKSLTDIMTKLYNAEYRIGTTGTLDGAETNALTLQGLFGPIKQVTTTKNLMDDDDIATLDIQMLIMKYPTEECKEFGKKTYVEEMDYIVRHTRRNNFIKNLAIDQDGNTLVLFQYVAKHGKVLFDLIQKAAHEKRMIFFVSGATGVDDRERVREITETQKNAIIVASYGVFSTGINIRNIHNIIFSSPSKSQVRVLQSVGRGLRKSDDNTDTFLFDITDDLHHKKRKNYTLNHGAERVKMYAKEKFKYQIYEVNI
jgi:superfamily II DNA or RNA helicase